MTPPEPTGSRTTAARAAAWAAAARAAAGGTPAPAPEPAVVCRGVVRFYRLDGTAQGRAAAGGSAERGRVERGMAGRGLLERAVVEPGGVHVGPGQPGSAGTGSVPLAGVRGYRDPSALDGTAGYRPDVLGAGAARAVPALRGVDLELAAGTVTALVGPSGSGKSTLLRLLACVDRADGGTIMIDGIDVTRLARRGRVRLRRHRLGFMFQNPADNLLEYLTVREHLELGAQLRGLSRKDSQIGDLLDRLGLADRADHLPRQLSGGEQQRVAIAFAALGPPALLVADEPTGQLDHSTVDSVLDAFEVLAATGVAVVAATHDPSVARRADRVVYLRDGRVEEGTRWT